MADEALDQCQEQEDLTTTFALLFHYQKVNITLSSSIWLTVCSRQALCLQGWSAYILLRWEQAAKFFIPLLQITSEDEYENKRPTIRVCLFYFVIAIVLLG